MRKIKTLKKNYEFKNVMSKGNYCCGKFITIYISKNNFKKNIIGIAVSTKSGNAVKRNKIKRLIRENYRLRKEKIKNGHNIVFLLNQRNKIEKIKYQDIERDMDNIFKRLDLYI